MDIPEQQTEQETAGTNSEELPLSFLTLFPFSQEKLLGKTLQL